MPETIANKRSLAPIAIVLALVLALLAIDTAAWAFACLRLQRSLAEASLQSTATRWRGWPLAAELVSADVTLRSAPDAIPELVWTVPTLTARLSILAPKTLTIIPAGRQTLTIGTAPPISVEAATLSADIDLAQQTPPHIAATALTIDASGLVLHIETATVDLPPSAASAIVTGLTVPTPEGPPLHPAIDTIRLIAHLTPPIVPMPTARESAQAWRAQSGHLDLDVQSFRWGALDATARATLTLDDALQPRADGTLTASGLAPTLTQLAGNALITQAAASAATALLAILAAPAAGRPVTLPVTWQAGVVSIARFPLLRTIPLTWD